MALQIRNNKIVIYEGPSAGSASTGNIPKVKFDTSNPMPTLTFEIGGTYTISGYPNSNPGGGVRSDVLQKILIMEHPSITNWADSFIFPTLNIYGGMINNGDNTIVGIGTIMLDIWVEEPGWFAGSVILYFEPEPGKLYLVIKYGVSSPNGKTTLRNTSARMLSFDTSSASIPLLNPIRIDYKVYYGRFTAQLANDYNVPTKSLVRALVVGGGGGGGGGSLGVAGGGGGGGEVVDFSKYYYNDLALDLRVGSVTAVYENWKPASNYTAGQVIKISDKFYRAKQAHTTGSTVNYDLYQLAKQLPTSGGLGGGATFNNNYGERGANSYFAGVYAYGGSGGAGGDAGGYDGTGFELAGGSGSGGSGYHADDSQIPTTEPAQNTLGVIPLNPTIPTPALGDAIAYNNSRYKRKETLGGPAGTRSPDSFNNQTSETGLVYHANSGGKGKYDFGGGGGGAGGVGQDAEATGRQPDEGKAGDGGIGYESDITGISLHYGAGGGGGGGRTDLSSGSIGLGGLGGGGNGGERDQPGGNALANTGGGGGGKGVNEYSAAVMSGWGKVEKTNLSVIVGKQTHYTSEVSLGDTIMFNNATRKVTAITDGTITVDRPFELPKQVNWISETTNQYTETEYAPGSDIIFGNWYTVHNVTKSIGYVGGNGGSGIVILRVPSDTVAEFTPDVVFTQITAGSDKVYLVTETRTDYSTVTFRKV